MQEDSGGFEPATIATPTKSTTTSSCSPVMAIATHTKPIDTADNRYALIGVGEVLTKSG